MDSYAIVACRICGKLMKRYAYAVYPGDASCCEECNEEVRKDEKVDPGGGHRGNP